MGTYKRGKETGVSTFWIEKGLDTGPVLVQKKESILPDDDAPALFDRLVCVGITAAHETLEKIASGDSAGTPQTGEPTYAPTLKKEIGKIDWSQPVHRILNLMRGTKPWPGTYALILNGRLVNTRLKILKASPLRILFPVPGRKRALRTGDRPGQEHGFRGPLRRRSSPCRRSPA